MRDAAKNNSSQWVIIGLDESGPAQWRDYHHHALEDAALIIADDRFHPMIGEVTTVKDRLMSWPKPFSDLKGLLAKHISDKVVICTTGDPMLYGAGISVTKLFPDQPIKILPALSGIQLAASAMAWSLTDVEVLSVHGRALTKLVASIYPFAKWLVVPQSATTITDIADLLTSHGWGAAQITCLWALGRGQDEAITSHSAKQWLASKDTPQDGFYMVAVDLAPCGRQAFLGQMAGLPDDAFISDGKLTKQDVRASALAKLQPHKKGVLWDLGTGAGSIAIEWARFDESCHAYGVDQLDKRLAMARENASRLGTANTSWIAGDITAIMATLPEPDAIFIGGGLSEDSLQAAMSYLPAGGRLVIHAVTLESEAILLEAHRVHGGQLTKIAVNKAEAVGPYRGWRGLMPVTQWVYVKESIS